jgi:hypothetical protein
MYVRCNSRTTQCCNSTSFRVAELARGLGLEYTHMDVAIADDGDGMSRRTLATEPGPVLE